MLEQRILLLSGEPETRQHLTRMLGVEGETVDAVADGAAAFQLVWDAEYDVIVAELGMPGIDGRDLYMAFQNTWPELTRRMVFFCAAPTAELEQFLARTQAPRVRGAVGLAELRDAVRSVREQARPRSFA